MYRTHTCGELNKEHIGKTVQLAGWVNSTRDHGGLIFIDLRDRFGLIQCTFDPKESKEAWSIAETVRSEYVLLIEGQVRERPEEMINPHLETGEIEINAKKIKIITKAKTPPFEIEWRPGLEKSASDKPKVAEEVRLQYRYLDLRTNRMLSNLKLRHRFIYYIREYLNQEGFLEIETPILSKSTPEGARDYIVPSRLHPGNFYALPQSPQQYKQLLMMASIDRYFQIARCFRDEDQRGDRQPEFTQLDLEMSFVERDDIMNCTENLFKTVFKRLINDKILNKKIVLDEPWPRLKYKDVMLKYGIDRPDIRFGLEIKELDKILKNTEFKIFNQALNAKNGTIRAINAKNAELIFSRKDIDELTNYIKKLGGGGLAYIKISKPKIGQSESNSQEINFNKQKLLLTSPILKFLSDEEIMGILEGMAAEADDIIFFGAGERKMVEETLAKLRLKLGRKLKLINKSELAVCWIIDFPLFLGKKEDGSYEPSHHMFTAPHPEDISLLETDHPLKARCLQYDLVINGHEVGGGSIRIHDHKLQEKIFDLIGFNEAKKKEFEHILRAFKFGAPPHGGIAPGLDRLTMLLAGEPNIREVMAFPKSQKGEDLMMNAPSPVDAQQLKEAHIKINE